jgi:polyhydroxybutyrate depolymerase
MKSVRYVILIAALVLPHVSPDRAVAQPAEFSTFLYQGIERHYVLHKPTDRAGALPLVIALHGLNESVADFRQSWTMDAVASRERFAVLYPLALAGRWAYADSRPVKLPNENGFVDDIGYLMSLLDKLIAEHIVDPSRIYVSGVSNGGLMAWALACRVPDRLAGVAPIISGMIDRQVEQRAGTAKLDSAISGTPAWQRPR